MRVYRNNLETFNSSQYFPVYEIDGICYAQDRITRSHLQPKNGVIVKTGSSFKEVSVSIDIQADKYYRLDGLREGTDELLWTEIDAETASEFATLAVFDIMEATYTGDDMGERKVVANIKYPTPIGFRIGDYIEIAMQSLTKNDTTIKTERFYIYSEPQCKKIARPMAAGDSFETIVTFYPPQYELGCIVLRDSIQEMSNVSNIIYTGFDTVTFEGGAFALLTRCVACMNAQFVDNDGKGLWSFDLAESLHEDNNRALERYLFSFSKTSVADALLKLNDPEQINTTFFINGRTIYAGYKRSYVCKVGSDMGITDVPMKFAYGKTSHLPVEHERGLLKNIFKSIGEEVPITKLFAYGATRNINRYYCADLIASGRYVNRLMLPSFSQDGHTDFVISEDGVKKFGIREGSKEFDNIYPTIQHMTYADIRGVKYCIKIKASGDEDDTKLESGLYDKQNSISKYAVARIQCYRVTPCTGNKDGEIGANKLVPCAPPEDLVVTVRATGKVVKCILRGGSTEKEAIDKQIASDGKWSNGNGRVPATSYHGSTYIPGACFCVHDNKFPDGEGKTYKDSERDKWFNAETIATTDSASDLHRMEYVDTVWITDVYAFESYQQTHFRRDGYSAGCWARINNDSGQNDTLLVNEVVAVEPVIITDTDTNTATNSNQKTWDLYLRDLGFSPDEQNDFGDRVFVFDTIKVSFLDGLLTGREFTIAGSMTDNQDVCVCAYNNDGTLNKYFFEDSGYTDGSVPQTAFSKGAIWRFRLNRLNDEELENLGIIIPTKTLCAKEGDHVTLLDIYMPDVYVRAAENRLLKEAMKYLRHNDKGDVKYTAEFDQVRINQIPNYALQMREGVRVRLVDDDLNITTENTTRKIVDYPNGLDSQVSMFTIEQNVTEKTIESTFYYTPGYEDITQFNPALSTRHPNVFKKYIENYDKESQIIKIKVPRNNSLSASVNNLELFISPRNKYSKTRDGYTAKTANISAIKNGTSTWSISFDCTQEEYDILRNDAHQIIVDLYESVIDTESHKYNNSGTPYYAIVNEIVEFLSGKFYDVVLDVESAFAGNQIEFLLCKSKDVESTKYIPAYTITEFAETGVKEGFTRIKVSFFLDDSFDDSVGYYPSVKYIADGNTEYTSIRLLSITEKDVDEDGNILNYADITVDHVTIKITDNTRNANTRILDSYPEPIREIQATFNSNKKASSWAKVMSRVGATEQEVEARKTTFQSITNDARRNYRALLSLRNSIFDPDSNTNDKCDYNFLRVMMMQVGADSMNYLLEKTYQSADGTPHNYSISRISYTSNPVFEVNSVDRLIHLVYVQSGENGHWTIPAPFSQTLQPNDDGSWSPYFVCIRCRKDGANALDEKAWICSKHQYAVNQDVNPDTGQTTDQYGNLMTDYWYFNWAILTCPENDGNYVLRETRGNAYMYGDSLICGKISSLAQNSYFDLNTGNFVLGGNKDGRAALSYIDGILTVNGTNDNIEDILTRLGLIESDVNKVIGGKNLLKDTAFSMEYNIGDILRFTHLYNLEAGKKYIASYGKFENNAGGATNEAFNGVCLVVAQSPALVNVESVVKFGEAFEVNGNGRYLYIAWASYDYVNYDKGNADPTTETATDFTQYLDQVMLQEGEVATAFQSSFDEELEEIEQAQENFQNSLDKINSDEYFSIAEKKIIRTDWETISGAARTTVTSETYSSLNGNYGEAYRAAESSSIATTDIDTAFVSLRDYLNTHELYEDTDTSWGSTGRKTLAEKFTAYYNAESALWSAINNAYADTKEFDDSSYIYLKKALENNTNVSGGIVATTFIQLRDWTGEYNSDGTKKYKVNAGLSGKEEDNVLFWGGGDYNDAVTAARNSDPDIGDGTYKKQNGIEITTLLKKDGMGKIGIYKISETQAVVDVPNQGKVIIDASESNGGIFVHDNQNIPRIIMTPKTIDNSGYAPRSNDEWKTSVSGSDSVSSSKDSMITTTRTLFSKSIDYDGKLDLSTLNITINNIRTLHAGMTDYTSATIVTAELVVKNGSVSTSMGIFSTSRGATSGSWSVSNKTISINKGDIEVLLIVSHGIAGTSYTSTTCNFSYSSYLSSLLIPAYQAKTVLCKNGIITAHGSTSYFCIENTDDGQDIRVEGLPEWSESLEKGRLCYIDGHDGYRHLLIKVNDPV